MNLVTSLRVFTRVADLSSFTRAAEALGLPKSRVSTIVRDLERELGVRLFHRTTRRVHLTREGLALQQRAIDLLADADELATMFQESPRALRGRVRIDMPNRLAHAVVVPRLPEFLAAHPHLEVELGSTDRYVDLVEEGFDGIVRVGELGESSLIARKLGFFPVASFASRAYLERFGTPRTLDDLASHQLVHYAARFGGEPYGFEAVQGDDVRTIAMPGRVTVNNSDAYVSACLAGLGIIQAPAVGRMNELLEAGELVEILPDLRPEPMPVTILYTERRTLAKRVRVFLDWIADVIEPELIRIT